MLFIKFYAMFAICAAPLWCSSNPADDDYIDPNTKTLLINSEKPLALLKRGILSPVMSRECSDVSGPAESRKRVAIPAIRDVLLGYVLNIESTSNPRQTVALDFREARSGVWELKVGNADFSDCFYPNDPREILIKMYATKSNVVQLGSSTFSCPFSSGKDLVATGGIEKMQSDSGIYVYEGKVAVAAKIFEVKHGTLLASPLTVEFMPLGNPFIKTLVVNGRPFYQDLLGLPVCFNAILLEMTGDSENLNVKASFVGGLHKPALALLLDPSIISNEDLQIFLAAQ